MSLDSRYVIAPSLQEYFVDKDSGLPLSGGKVYFFQDTARTVPKDVFELSGSPPNYTYTVLPNPVTLSAVGTFQDASGNDIIPYYFPYVSLTDSTVQLYYIEVYNSDGVLQFTREGWPNFIDGNVSADQDITNFVPNGQFLLHDNIPASAANGYIANKISEEITTIAQGGWTFERGAASAATDLVSFPRYNSAITSPTGNPRYACQIQTTVPGSDARKDLCLNFPDVNKFASTTQSYNFYFEGQSLTLSDIPNVQIIVRKFYGTGGSPSGTETTVVSSITLTSSIQKFNTSILFGTNQGKSIGTNNDDYVQIILRFPPTGTQSALVTNFCLTINSDKLTTFPTQTNAEQLDESTAGWFPTPDPDGFDLYLPAILTKSGLTFSDADIGKIFAAMYNTLPIGELLCDGTQYLTENYSSDGIPYARLQAKWFNSSNSTNYFGNGSNYVSANYTNLSSGSNTFRLNLTTPGSATIADVSTGFGFAKICDGLTTGEVGYVQGGIVVIDNTIGTRTAPSAGTSGFGITVLRNSAVTYHIFEVTNTPTVTPGTYFTFTSGSGSFYMWFTVDGVGADPMVPLHTAIAVNLLSTYNQNEIARCIQDAISGYQTSHISPVIGSSVVPGSYFTITTPAPSSTIYYVWYTKDGTGSDPQPSVSQSLKIKVEVLSTDSIATVVEKTVIAINMKYFAVPDLRGLFLRGCDDGAGVDLDTASRYTQINVPLTNELGTFQTDQLFLHQHGSGTLSGFFTSTDEGAIAPGAFGFIANRVQVGTYPVTIQGSTATVGGSETRPINVYVQWVTKY